MEENKVPIAVYNVEKQELAFIFSSYSSCGQAFYPTENITNVVSRIRYWVKNKKKKNSEMVDFPLAFRIATIEQEKMLKGREVLCTEGYNIRSGREHRKNNPCYYMPRTNKTEELINNNKSKIIEEIQKGVPTKEIADSLGIVSSEISRLIKVKKYKSKKD